jgi:hypothetical protein
MSGGAAGEAALPARIVPGIGAGPPVRMLFRAPGFDGSVFGPEGAKHRSVATPVDRERTRKQETAEAAAGGSF